MLQPALASWFDLDGRYPSAGPVMVFGAIALLGLLAVLAALRWILAGRPAGRETVARAALLAPVGAAAAVALGRDPGYVVSPGTVTVQVVVLALPVLAALAVARWWALGTAADTQDPADSTALVA